MKGILTKRPITMLGLVLIVTGLLGPTILTTVNIDTTAPSLGPGYPSGTSSSPTPFNIGASYTLEISVSNEVSAPNGTVTIGSGTPKPLTVSARDAYGIYHLTTSWIATDLGLTPIPFVWTIRDASGNTSTKTTYGSVGDIPAMNAYINDQLVTTTGTLTLTTRVLNFKFVPTRAASRITNVMVSADGAFKTGSTKGADGNWTSTWTAPSDGTYEITANLTYADGLSVRVMSVLAGIPGITPPESQSWLTYLAYIGAAMVVLGLVTKR